MKGVVVGDIVRNLKKAQKKLRDSSSLTLPPLILASASPRRIQLLQASGLKNTSQKSPQVEEKNATPRTAKKIAVENAFLKAKDILSQSSEPNTVIIGADTIVVTSKKVLGKPYSKEEAEQFLKLLSGKTHTVITGLALLSHQYGERKSFEETKVSFKKLSTKEIEDYILTSEPYDKAGAYGVQGLASLFINKITGSYTNVMGFPIEKFLKELSLFTKISLGQWF